MSPLGSAKFGWFKRLYALAQQDRLEEGRINIEVTRPAEGISWQISEIGLCGCGCKLARSETRRINCRVATDCLHIGIQHIRQYRPTETSRQGGALIGDAERSSGVRAQDSAGRPPAEDRVREPVLAL